MAERPGNRCAEVGPGEGLGDVAHVTLGVEALAVERGDAAGLLAAVLKRVQAERDEMGRVGRVEDAEHAALQSQPVVVAPSVWHSLRHGRFSTSTFSDWPEASLAPAF